MTRLDTAAGIRARVIYNSVLCDRRQIRQGVRQKNRNRDGAEWTIEWTKRLGVGQVLHDATSTITQGPGGDPVMVLGEGVILLILGGMGGLL